MRPLELLFLYVLIGLGLSAAWSRSGRSGAASVAVLWPLFVPTLLGQLAPVLPEEAPALGSANGPWGDRIHGAVEALRRALGAWTALPDAAQCEASLRAADRGLRALAERHAQLDGVLSGPESDAEALRLVLSSAPETARPLLEARLANLQRLQGLREEAAGELERALAGLADLSTRVHLARFTGDAAQELTDQLTRLAAAVDGASEVARLGR